MNPPTAQGAPFIYKWVMGWLDGDPVHREMEMLHHIHQNGYASGIVWGVEFNGEPITIDISIWDLDGLNQWNAIETHEQVTLQRSSAMIYLDTGTPIPKGKAVLDLVAGFFDIVEGMKCLIIRIQCWNWSH